MSFFDEDSEFGLSDNGGSNCKCEVKPLPDEGLVARFNAAQAAYEAAKAARAAASRRLVWVGDVAVEMFAGNPRYAGCEFDRDSVTEYLTDRDLEKAEAETRRRQKAHPETSAAYDAADAAFKAADAEKDAAEDALLAAMAAHFFPGGMKGAFWFTGDDPTRPDSVSDSAGGDNRTPARWYISWRGDTGYMS